MRAKIIQFLDDPSTRASRAVVLTLLALIYVSIAQLVIEMRYPDFASTHAAVLQVIQYTVLSIFSLELLIRVICDHRGWRYLGSFYGAIDLLAVAPGLLGLLAPIPSNFSWIRAFRILRFGRALKLLRLGGLLGGVTGRLAPFFALALGFKGLAVALEGEPWWPNLGNLTIVIGVSGFALAILLGTKMRVISGRLYAVEDAICRIVGSLRDMGSNDAVRGTIGSWAREFEAVLLSSGEKAIQRMKFRTDELEQALEAAGIGGPVTAGFHRDVEYVLHRATTRTPQAYESFLRYVTVVYAGMVVIAVPGLTGFFASVLLIYVLGGMYVLIDDMDSPFDFGEDSLVSIDIRPLKAYNGLRPHLN